MTAKYKLIIFDWDGTLFDSTSVISHTIAQTLEHYGITPPVLEKITATIGLSLHDAWHILAPHSLDHNAMSAYYSRLFLARKNSIYFFDGIVKMLKDLREKGYKLAIATSKSRQGLDSALERSIEQEQLAAFFDATRTADTTAPKPNPQMLVELAQEIGVAMTEVVMIGDTSYDMMMAQNAGCDAVAVSYGAHNKESLQQSSALVVCDTVAGLHQFLCGKIVVQ